MKTTIDIHVHIEHEGRIPEGEYVGNLGWLHLVLEILRHKDNVPFDPDDDDDVEDKMWRLSLRDSLYALCKPETLHQIQMIR